MCLLMSKCVWKSPTGSDESQPVTWGGGRDLKGLRTAGLKDRASPLHHLYLADFHIQIVEAKKSKT